MDLATAAEIIAAAETGNTARLRTIAGRGCVVRLVSDARDIMNAEFRIVKAQRGYVVFEGLAEEYTVALPRKKDAEAWIARETDRRAELVDFEIARLSIPAPRPAPRKPAPVQLEMFA